MTESEFLSKLDFASDKKRGECQKYIKMKGLQQHIRIAERIGYGVNGRIPYAQIEAFYKKDKRLRDTLYKYLAMFEERIRAYISNLYEAEPPINIINAMKDKAKKAYLESKSLILALEETTFGELMEVTKVLSPKDKAELFRNETSLVEDNLKAIKTLRNKVCHNIILTLYKNFDYCVVDGNKNNSLENNILNLRQCMIAEYRSGFTKEVSGLGFRFCNTVASDE